MSDTDLPSRAGTGFLPPGMEDGITGGPGSIASRSVLVGGSAGSARSSGDRSFYLRGRSWRRNGEDPCDHPRVTLDEWVIMPDHMHGILIFHTIPGRARQAQAPPGPVPWDRDRPIQIRSDEADLKNLRQRSFAWQPRFYDVIVRDPSHLERLRAYIQANPTRWKTKT